MQFTWTISILPTAVSLALLIVVIHRKQMLTVLKEGTEKGMIEFDELNKIHANREFFKETVQTLLIENTKALEDLETRVAKLSPALETKKKDKEACEAEKKTKAVDLVATKDKHSKMEATLKAEADAWQKEISTLKGQLTGYRPICDYVKQNPEALKLCGTKPAKPLLQTNKE